MITAFFKKKTNEADAILSDSDDDTPLLALLPSTKKRSFTASVECSSNKKPRPISSKPAASSFLHHVRERKKSSAATTTIISSTAVTSSSTTSSSNSIHSLSCDPIETFGTENVDPGAIMISPPSRIEHHHRKRKTPVSGTIDAKYSTTANSVTTGGKIQQTLTPYIVQQREIKPSRWNKCAIWSSSYKSILPAFNRMTTGYVRPMDRKNFLQMSLNNYNVVGPELDSFARVHSYVRASRNYPSNSIAFTAMEFDDDGILLVASDPKGGFRIYDFDTYLQKSMENENMRDRNIPIPQEKPFCLAPIHCVETPECQSLAWHPANPDYVVSSYRSNNEVHLWDLSRFPQNPKSVFHTKQNVQRGNRGKRGSRGIVCFEAAGGKRGGSKSGGSGYQIAAGGGESCVVRVWDPRTSSTPVYTFPTNGRKGNQNSHVNALCYCHSQGLIYYGDGSGKIAAHDMRRYEIPAFSTKKTPKFTGDMYLPGIINSPNAAKRAMNSKHGRSIISLVSDPSNSGHVSFRSRSGLVGVVDTSRVQQYDRISSNSSSFSSTTTTRSNSSPPSLRVIGFSLAVVPKKTEIINTTMSSSSTSSSVTVLPSTTSTRYQEARVGSYDTVPSNFSNTNSASANPSNLSIRRNNNVPYHSMKYLGGADPVLCIGAASSCQLQLVPIDGKNGIRIAKVPRLGSGGGGFSRETNQVDKFVMPAQKFNPGDMTTSIHPSSGSETKLLEGYKVLLETDGDKLGGGVTSVACHYKTGKIVSALDNGKCLVASSRGEHFFS
jgi:hypothetical protein